MRLFTTEERKIGMPHLSIVSKREEIIFPLAVLLLCILFLPTITSLAGMFCLGNLTKKSGVVDRLSISTQNELINVVTIFLGLAVGSKLSADKFLTKETLAILASGAIAYFIGTADGVTIAKLMSKLSSQKINRLIDWLVRWCFCGAYDCKSSY
jgi:oxaloacetate decarboxylase beta subunit